MNPMLRQGGILEARLYKDYKESHLLHMVCIWAIWMGFIRGLYAKWIRWTCNLTGKQTSSIDQADLDIKLINGRRLALNQQNIGWYDPQ